MGHKFYKMNKVILITCLFVLSTTFVVLGKLNVHQFPEPERTSERLFYIQRSLNKNTVVYDACFDEQGKLIADSPVKIYWIRYDEEGQTMPLRFFEKQFAFGVKIQKLEGKNYDYKITLAAWPQRAIYLRQLAPYKVVAYLNINGVDTELDHIFIGSDPGGSLTKAEYIEVYGVMQNSSTINYERILL